MVITQFTPLASILGGALIGVAAVLLMLFHGRIAGVSGILSRVLPPYHGRRLAHDIAFLTGLVVAPLAYEIATGGQVTQTVSPNVPLMVAAGLIVGFGTIYGNGCTSGHGVCGLSRLSRRSIVATAIFMITAFATVLLMRHGIGS